MKHLCHERQESIVASETLCDDIDAPSMPMIDDLLLELTHARALEPSEDDAELVSRAQWGRGGRLDQRDRVLAFGLLRIERFSRHGDAVRLLHAARCANGRDAHGDRKRPATAPGSVTDRVAVDRSRRRELDVHACFADRGERVAPLPRRNGVLRGGRRAIAAPRARAAGGAARRSLAPRSPPERGDA